MRRFVVACCTVAFAACSQQDATSPISAATGPSLNRDGGDDLDLNRGAAAFTITNSTSANAVRAYARASNGALTFVADYPTGGTGTGGGLGNQGALVFAGGGRFLLAVNAGSNQLSSFRVSGTTLSLVNTVSSGGIRPVSVTASEGSVYVLNAGGTGNISGFRMSGGGSLSPMSNSTRALSSTTAGAAEVSFDTEGEQLVVTEKATDRIITYQIGDNDLPGNAMIHASAGKTPFGFQFTSEGLLVVSEAFGGGAGASAASSYGLREGGVLTTKSASVPTTQSAACWVAITPSNRFAYLTNTGSNTITGYRISSSGALTRLRVDGINGSTGAGPIDAALSTDGAFLYTLNAGGHSVSIFRVDGQGNLVAAGTTAGVPVGATGLLVR